MCVNMNKRERGLSTRLNEFRYFFLATTCLMLLLATACRNQSSPLNLPPTPAFASTAVATAIPPSVIVPESTITKEAPLPQVDMFLLGSSTVKDIADLIYATTPDTILDDQTMNQIGNPANDTNVYNLNVDGNGLSGYFYGRFGGTIGGKEGAIEWLKKFREKRVTNIWQPKKIVNKWGNEYRYAKDVSKARDTAKDMVELIGLERTMFPRAKITIVKPPPVTWEDPKNREAYFDEIIRLLRIKRQENPAAYSEITIIDPITPLVMIDGKINPLAFKTPAKGEPGPTHLRDDLVPFVFFNIVNEVNEVIW